MIQKSMSQNYIYNLCFQILSIITPLITAPYISRVLQADSIGLYSYITAIVSYYLIFGTLGTSIYAGREISYNQQDRRRRTVIFWEIEFLRMVLFSFCVAAYIFYIFLQSDNRLLFVVCGIQLLGIVVDVTWFYTGIEEFRVIVIKNIVIKIICTVCVFLFVRSKQDLWIYILLSVGIPTLWNFSLWPLLSKYIDHPNIQELRPFRHLKEAVIFFIPTIATQVYLYIDKLMIGICTDTSFQNGFYEQAQKVEKTLVIVVTSLGPVVRARVGAYFSKGELKKIQDAIYRSINFIWFLGIPLCIGLACIAANFVPWFFGSGYDEVIDLLKILSVLILIVGMSNIIGMQYLIPVQRQKAYTFAIISGMIINVLLNIIFIPQYYAKGAAFASVVAELLVVLIDVFIVRKEFQIRKIVGLSKNYILAGGVMALMLLLEDYYLKASICNTIIMFLTGMGVYAIVLSIIKDKFFYGIILEYSKKLKAIYNSHRSGKSDSEY